MKKVIFSGFALLMAAAIFTLSFNDNRLESLKADAYGDTKCVETRNCDCKSPDTGTIYNGYKLKNIGGEVEEVM